MATYAEREQLHVRVLVVETTLQGTHGIFWSHGLGANLVAYLKVERNILGAGGQEF